MTSSVLLLQRRLARDTKAAKFEMKGYFTNKSMVIFTAANFFFFLVLFIPYVSAPSPCLTRNISLMMHSFTLQFFISLYGLQYGASDHEAFYLTAILNGSAFLGCLVLGVVADRSVGFFNTITAVAFACTITAAAWVAAQSFSGVVTWTVVYGFLAGGIQAIFSPCIALLVPDPELIGTWNGKILNPVHSQLCRVLTILQASVCLCCLFLFSPADQLLGGCLQTREGRTMCLCKLSQGHVWALPVSCTW